MSKKNSLLDIHGLSNKLLFVPVRIKVIGIGLLPIIILGFSLNYWITTGLSDWLSYILTDVRVQAAMEVGGRSVFFVTVLGAVVSILFSLLLAHILTEPILSLKKMAQQVADGKLDVRAKVSARDEIGELAAAIHTMTDHLVSQQEALVRKNRSLDAINQVAMAANKTDDIHEVLYLILEHILNTINLKLGWIYLRDPEKNTIHLASWYGVEEEMIPIFLSILTGSSCTCQEYLVKGDFNAEVQTQVCGRLEKLTRLTIGKNHVTVPLIARDQHFGMINLVCEDGVVISTEDMDLLSAIGKQVSEIIANAWLHLKLVEKETARQFLLESLVRAQEEERARLARELHDGAGQTLTSLLVRMKVMERKSQSPEIKTELNSILDIVSDTIEQLRELAYRLRPAALDDFGLARALEALGQDMTTGTGINIAFDFTIPTNNISSEIDVVLYRIAQEGLTNIIRHSKAKEIRLALACDETGVWMTIEDDGIGFDPNNFSPIDGQRHLGLISMRERAEILGGVLDVYTAPSQGTNIDVFIPINY